MSDEEFIGRKEELGHLEKLWQSEGLVTCCMWGRKFMGKSRLLEEFSKDKRTIHFKAMYGSYYENLCSLSMDVSEFLGRDIGTVKDLSHLMSYVEDICSEAHTLVIIDELPYLIGSAPQAASVIQKSLDRGFRNIDCMFVVCGSSITAMHRETEDYGKPLYGRFTDRVYIDHIGLRDSKEFLSDIDPSTALQWYLTVGGIPRNLREVRNGTYGSNLCRTFLVPRSAWKDYAPRMILEEFRGNCNYTGAVKCIADGHTRQSMIAEKLGIDRAACKRILDDLEYTDIIERRHPMFGSPRKPVYRIKDPFIAFHYGVVSKNLRAIGISESPETVYDVLRDRIDSHLGHMFEIVCAQWLEENYPVLEIGSWWGKDRDGEDVDIDIVAKVSDHDGTVRTLVGECRFGKNPIGFTPLNVLRERCEDASITENVRYILFSAGGFQEELKEYAEENGIILVDRDTLLGVR